MYVTPAGFNISWSMGKAVHTFSGSSLMGPGAGRGNTPFPRVHSFNKLLKLPAFLPVVSLALKIA